MRRLCRYHDGCLEGVLARDELLDNLIGERGFSADSQAIYAWRRQQLIDSGQIPGLTSTGQAELMAAALDLPTSLTAVQVIAHTVRSAWVGERWAARIDGYRPAVAPMARAAPIPP